MNDYYVNQIDERLENIQRDDFDCFTFDALSISSFKRILNGKSVNLREFLLSDDLDANVKERYILSKVRLIDNIVKNNPYTKSFLVFQTISWKIKKTKMPFILIPVRIFDGGARVVKDGEPFINPVLEEYIDEFEYTITDKTIFSLDNSEISKFIEEANGRIIYEMYLTHFKVTYNSQKVKTNKKFVKLENSFDYLETNRDLTPIDFELINIKKAVMDGNNTLINAGQGTRKVALIVNLISEFIYKSKSILYISEKNYRSLREEIKRVGLSAFIDDKLDTNYIDTEVEFESNVDSKRLLRETVQLLKSYQENFSTKHKGFLLSKVFSELILLDEIEEKKVEVEFFDEIEHSDVESIRKTLMKIQLIIDRENYSSPADEVWNELDIRSIRYRESTAIKDIRLAISELDTVQDTIMKLKLEQGIIYSNDTSLLPEELSNLEFMNLLQYPQSWVVGDNFVEAKATINKANSLAGRTQSLFTTIRMSFKEEILKVETDKTKSKLFGNYFSDSDYSIMNKILKNNDVSKKAIQKIQEELERLLYFKEQFELLMNVKLKEFITFIPGASSILLDKNLELKWLNYTKKKKNTILDLLNEESENINQFIDIKEELSQYFSSDIEELEEEFITSYVTNLIKNSRKSPETVSVNTLVEQYATNKYISLGKKRKINVSDKLLELTQILPHIKKVKNDLNELLEVEVSLNKISTIKHLFEQMVVLKGSHKFRIEFSHSDLKELLTEFNTTAESFSESIMNPLFDSIRKIDILDLETELDEFSIKSKTLLETAAYMKSFYKSTPNNLSMQSMIATLNSVRNYQYNFEQLSINDSTYKRLYGDYYTGMDTIFKSIRIVLKNFNKYLGTFGSDKTAVKYFKKQEFKYVNETLYQTRIKTKSLNKCISSVNKYFVNNITLTNFDELRVFLNQFTNHYSMVKWVEFVDSLQNLRNYSQLRLAANINNGFLKKNLVDQFNYGFYKRIIHSYHSKFDSLDIINKMKSFNDLNRDVHMQRRIEVQALKRRKKTVLSNVSGIANSKVIYDLIIIDGAERVHSSLMQKLLSMGKTAMVVFDEGSSNIDDSMYNYLRHQPMYNLKNNYRLSPFLLNNHDIGVLYKQKIEIRNMMNIVEKVVTILDETNQRVNVICSNNRERVDIFNLINSRMINTKNSDNEEFANRLYVLIYEEYLPSSDVTFLIVNESKRSGLINAINTALRNSRRLVILDESDYLKEQNLESKLKKDLFDMFDDTIDRLSKHVFSKLDIEYQVRRMVSPYDFVIGEGNKIYCLVKITFNNNTMNDILEETLMLFDKEYENIPKFIISIEDLYFKQDKILNELKEVIEDGKRKQNKS